MQEWIIDKAIKSDYRGALKRILKKNIPTTEDFLDELSDAFKLIVDRPKKFSYICLVCFKKFCTRQKQVGKYCSRACKDESQRGAGISKLDALSPVSLRDTFQKRLEYYIEKTDTCWKWKGPITQRGYGRIFFNRKYWVAHRATWTIYAGAIPKGKIICHSCDNRLCANPKHLFLGTHKDNMVDAAKKARLSRLGLPLEDLKNIKKEILHTVYENYADIAKRYGLTELYIKRIAKGERWSAIRI